MTSVKTIRAPILGILIIQLAALIARAFFEVKLKANGNDETFSADFSYLVVPPILAFLLFPILRDHKIFLRSWFRCEQLTLKLVLSAIGIGLFLRIAWWCQLVFRISTGITTNSNPNAIVGPTVTLECPTLMTLLLGFLVMAVLVPVIEEVICRGLIQSTLANQGKVIAIVVSAVIFAAYHPPANYFLTLLIGLVLGVQFWNSRTLWFSIITHATYNSLVQLDWRCTTGYWNPNASDLPQVEVATFSAIGLTLSVIAAAFLIKQNTVEAR